MYARVVEYNCTILTSWDDTTVVANIILCINSSSTSTVLLSHRRNGPRKWDVFCRLDMWDDARYSARTCSVRVRVCVSVLLVLVEPSYNHRHHLNTATVYMWTKPGNEAVGSFFFLFCLRLVFLFSLFLSLSLSLIFNYIYIILFSFLNKWKKIPVITISSFLASGCDLDSSCLCCGR